MDLQLNGMNLFTGPNNNGKTSLLHAIVLAYDALCKIAELDEDGEVSFTFKGNRSGSRGRFLYKEDISFYISNAYETIRDKKYKRPSKIEITYSNGLVFSFFLEQAPHFLRVVAQNTDNLVSNKELVKSTLQHRPLYIPSFTGIDPTEPFMHPGQIAHRIQQGQSGYAVKNLIYQISQEPDKLTRLEKSLQSHFGTEFRGFSIESNPEQDTEVSVKLRIDRTSYDLTTMGSGFLQIAGILAMALHFENADGILLDEPDAHLHANLQESLLKLLDELMDGDLSSSPKQIFIATHSPELINNVSIKNIFHIHNGKCSSNVQERKHLENLLDELGVGNFELVRYRNFGKLLLAENESDYKALKLWARQLREGWPEHFGKVFLHNRDWKKVDLGLLKQLTHSGLKTLIFLDRDGRTESILSEEDKELSRKFNYHLVWSRSMIESYLVNPTAYLRFVNGKLNQQEEKPLTLHNMEEVIDEACDELRRQTEHYIFEFVAHHKTLFPASDGRHRSPKSLLEMAEQYVEDCWQSRERRISIVRGKDLVAKINDSIQSRYKVSVTSKALLQCFEPEIIHPDIKKCIEMVQTFSGEQKSGQLRSNAD